MDLLRDCLMELRKFILLQNLTNGAELEELLVFYLQILSYAVRSGVFN